MEINLDRANKVFEIFVCLGKRLAAAFGGARSARALICMLVGVWLFVGSACSRSADETTTAPPFPSSSPEFEPLAGGSADAFPSATLSPLPDTTSLDLVSFDSSLAVLDSYHWTMSVQFTGEDLDGNSSSWQLQSTLAFSDDQSAMRYDVFYEGLDSSEIQELTVVQIGEEQFLSVPALGCMSVPMSKLGSFESRLITPERFLSGLEQAEFISAGEIVDGVPTRHYRFDQQALASWRDSSMIIDGHLFVAEDGAYVARVVLEATGQEDFLALGIEQGGTLRIEVDVLDVNQPTEVSLPAACQEPAGFPLTDDAYQVTVLEELVSYRTLMSFDQVVQYYQEQMPIAGWTALDEEAIFEDTAILIFQKGSRTVTVSVDESSAEQAVVVLITP